MRTYWITLISASAALIVVGLLLGGVFSTATGQGVDCGAPFGSSTDSAGQPMYGPDCQGPRAQASQLPVALLMLGGSGLLGAAVGGFIVSQRRTAERLARERTSPTD